MVSVVIPLYNKRATVERAVRSVLAQTVQDFEIIVVNDGSTDGSVDVVRGISDPRLRICEQGKQGVSMARNRGVRESTCDWVAFLDADDEWMPTFLETVCRLRESYPDCDVCATSYRRQNSNGTMRDIRLARCPDSRDFTMDDYFNIAAHSDPPFCSISVMIRKEALLAVGGFPQGIHQGEDLLTWARLAARYGIVYCREPQSIFHVDEESPMAVPRRHPADDDPVGHELAKLNEGLSATSSPKPRLASLPAYIAHWHKMRASIYLRLEGEGKRCRREAKESLRWSTNNRTVLNAYRLLSLLPYGLRMRLLRTIGRKRVNHCIFNLLNLLKSN